MLWDIYYVQFSDWSDSRRLRYLSDLTSYGLPNEITEIALEFSDDKGAQRLIKNAVDAGVEFTLENLNDLNGVVDTHTLVRVAGTVKEQFLVGELLQYEDEWEDEVLDFLLRNNTVERISLEQIRDGMNSGSKVEVSWGDEAEAINEKRYMRAKSSGRGVVFLGFLFPALSGIGGGINGHDQRHGGKCTGNCATCPPHYGYRYGRWYYGHGHQYGCEFGGNKGDGGRD